MPILDNLLDVQISFEATPLSVDGFGTPMLLGVHKRFNQRIKYYANIEEVAVDFDENDPEYQALLLAFSQDPRSGRIAVGRRDVDNVVITVDDAEEGFVYSVTINGVEFTYTALLADGVEEIALGLVNAINGGSEPVAATDNVDGTFDIDSDVAGVAYTLEVGDKLLLTDFSASNTMNNDLTAIEDASGNWYGLALTSRDSQDQLDASAWVEARTKLFIAATDDEDVLDPASTGDIAYLLQDLDRIRSSVLYHSQAADNYLELAWMAKQFTTDPGSSTWAYKTVSGVSSDELTSTQFTNAKDKNANVFITVADRSVTLQGTVAGSGPRGILFLDSIRGRDWLVRSLQEAVLTLFIANPKIEYTNNGFSQIRATLSGVLDIAQDAGFLSDDPAPVVFIPRVQDIPAADRANRFVPGIEITATEAGAVHTIRVRGSLSI